MSRWFADHRQQFIAGTLRTYGQINRSALVAKFDISAVQASADIGRFMREHPEAISYDESAKCYVANPDGLTLKEAEDER